MGFPHLALLGALGNRADLKQFGEDGSIGPLRIESRARGVSDEAPLGNA
jgi:hypothetical protein